MKFNINTIYCRQRNEKKVKVEVNYKNVKVCIKIPLPMIEASQGTL